MNLSELLKNSNVSIGGSQNKNLTEFVRIPTETAGYKLVYPMRGEKLSVRIFLNEKSGRLFRDIHRHEYTLPSKYTVKAPCLKSTYEVDCPICNAIKNITDIKGKEVLSENVKYSKRFITFAYINSVENKSQLHEVNAGETVLLMLPITVVSELTNVLKNCSSEEDVNKFFNSNNCLSFIISVDNNVSTSMYKVMPDAIKGQTKLFENDEDYTKLIQSLPSLDDLVVPSVFNENYLTLANQVADELNKNYLSGSIEATTMKNIENETKANDILNSINKIANEVQPQVQSQPTAQQPQYQTQTVVSQPQTIVAQAQPQQVIAPTIETKPIESVTTSAQPVQPTQSSVPPCFGNYNELEAKCLICANSVECSTKKIN